MSYACFIQAVEYDVTDLFIPARLWALTDDGHLRANEGYLIPLTRKMRADVLYVSSYALLATIPLTRRLLALRVPARLIAQRLIVSDDSYTTLLTRPFFLFRNGGTEV